MTDFYSKLMSYFHKELMCASNELTTPSSGNELTTPSSGNKLTTPSSSSVADELKNRFDVLVLMNEARTVPKGKSMATFGLKGCIGGYIDNPDTNTFFHYSPLLVPMIDSLIRKTVSNKTLRVYFFVPFEYQKNSDGKYEEQPKPEYKKMLAPFISRIRSIGIECVFCCYNECCRSGDDYLARSQGTAWIDKNGQLFVEGMPIRTKDRKIGAKPLGNNGPS